MVNWRLVLKISKLSSTVFLITVCISIYLFGLIFFIYSNADSKTLTILKDALSTTSGFFGGITTLVAAYIASRLFNDWKEQHNLQIIAQEAKEAKEAKEAFQLFHVQRNSIHLFIYQLEDIANNNVKTNISDKNIADNFQNTIVNAYNLDKDIMSSFCFLTMEQDIYNLTMEYYETIQSMDNCLSARGNLSFSDTSFLNKKKSEEYLILFNILEEKNRNILNELKKFIFVK
jgi:hypothetical protein